MSNVRQQRQTNAGPASWVLLLGLMVLALVIAGISKGCGDSDTTDVVGGGTATTATSTTGTTPSGDQAIIDQINAAVTAAGGIQFVSGKSDLTEASKATLDNVAQILSRNPKVRAQVNGHTDTQGDATKNQTLSQQRADAVVAYLATKGIAASRLTSRGFGETSPLVSPDDTEDQRKKNRRVEFRLVS